MLPPWLYLPLFLTPFLPGFVDTIAGGGGLITIPVLLSCGLSPQAALGTNKLQASFGSGSATWHFARAGLVSLAECRLGIVCTAIGALAGALVVLWYGGQRVVELAFDGHCGVVFGKRFDHVPDNRRFKQRDEYYAGI